MTALLLLPLWVAVGLFVESRQTVTEKCHGWYRVGAIVFWPALVHLRGWRWKRP